MTLSTFPTFLTFLTQTLCFSAPASDPWQGLEIPPYPRSERLEPQTVGPPVGGGQSPPPPRVPCAEP